MPIPNPTVVDLKVRPIQSADLCFEVDGILGEQNPALASLGTQITGFDLQANLYAHLGDLQSIGSGRLAYDSATIRKTLAPRCSSHFGRSQSVPA